MMPCRSTLKKLVGFNNIKRHITSSNTLCALFFSGLSFQLAHQANHRVKLDRPIFSLPGYWSVQSIGHSLKRFAPQPSQSSRQTRQTNLFLTWVLKLLAGLDFSVFPSLKGSLIARCGELCGGGFPSLQHPALSFLPQAIDWPPIDRWNHSVPQLGMLCLAETLQKAWIGLNCTHGIRLFTDSLQVAPLHGPSAN
ncbi:hypothetical protein RRG08_009626 [Elysia crispata]|uniref:Uncharacterized protein n=1 Tax=Elysia crispata TaxID=231223 RepID=A0AAE0XTG8_9GAST|nr:hypothetical protein RRG08_009626 [Elysia crispata]